MKPVKAAYSVLARRVDRSRRPAGAPHLPSVGDAHHQAPRAPLRRPDARVRRVHRGPREHARRVAARRRADQRRRLDGPRPRRLLRHRRLGDVPGHAGLPALRVPVAPAGGRADRRRIAWRSARCARSASTTAGSTSSCSGSRRTDSFRSSRSIRASRRSSRDLYEKRRRRAIRTACSPTCRVGRTPQWVRGEDRFAAATSFVFREFDGAVKIAPEPRADPMALRALSRRRAADLHQARQQPLARDEVARQLPLCHREPRRHVARGRRAAFRGRVPQRVVRARRDRPLRALARHAQGNVTPTMNSAPAPPSTTNSPQYRM